MVSAILHDYICRDIDVLTSTVTPNSGWHSILPDGRLEEVEHGG
jgi:hypothetical protein